MYTYMYTYTHTYILIQVSTNTFLGAHLNYMLSFYSIAPPMSRQVSITVVNFCNRTHNPPFYGHIRWISRVSVSPL